MEGLWVGMVKGAEGGFGAWRGSGWGFGALREGADRAVGADGSNNPLVLCQVQKGAHLRLAGKGRSKFCDAE